MPDLTAAENPGTLRLLTMEDTLGPFFPAAFVTNSSVGFPATGDGKTGLIEVQGAIRDAAGALVPVALVESWQPDGDGRFDGFMRQYVEDGYYRLRMARPGPVPPSRAGGNWRAPHITITLFCDGIARLATQLFLDGEALNETDPLLGSLPKALRPRLVARRPARTDMTSYRRDLVLRGRQETPFFDDLAADRMAPSGDLSHGRQLQIGETDLTSAARTPAHRLRLIPPAARASFVPSAHGAARLLPGENDLTRRSPGASRAAGEPILVTGLVLDEAGRPQPNTLIEIWNANSYGRYDHPDDPGRAPLDPLFAGIGRTVTDDEGRYAFLTIRPAPYLARPDIDRWRPAHIHLSVMGAATRLVTQMYFPNDPRLAADPSFRLLGDAAVRQLACPIAWSSENDCAAYGFDIVVAGARQSWIEGSS